MKKNMKNILMKKMSFLFFLEELINSGKRGKTIPEETGEQVDDLSQNLDIRSLVLTKMSSTLSAVS